MKTKKTSFIFGSTAQSSPPASPVEVSPPKRAVPTGESPEAPTKLRPPTVVIVTPLKKVDAPRKYIPKPRRFLPPNKPDKPKPVAVPPPRKDIVSSFIDTGTQLTNAIPKTKKREFDWAKFQTKKAVDAVKSVDEALTDLINKNLTEFTGRSPPQPRRKVTISEDVRAELAG